MHSIVIHFSLHLDSPVGSTLLVGCGSTVVVEVEDETIIGCGSTVVVEVEDETLIGCGSTVSVNMITLLSSANVER